MANNLWNLRRGNVHASNRDQHPHPNNNSPIACRLCNQVFLSNEALINHIDSHIAHEENNLRTLNPTRQITSERGPLPNRFPPNISMPIQMQETRNLPDNRAVRAPQQPAVMPPTRRHSFAGAAQVVLPPLQNYSSARNSMTARMDFPVSHFQLPKMEESSSDGTKPYIKQLEKPIKSIQIIDLVDEDNDLQALDLSLTL